MSFTHATYVEPNLDIYVFVFIIKILSINWIHYFH